MSDKKPVKVFKAGGVKAAIWENTIKRDGKQIIVNSVQIDRTYMQGDEYKQTNSFNTQDLPKLDLVTRLAFEFLTMRDQESDKDKIDNKAE